MALEARIDRLEAALLRLTEAQVRTEARLEELAAAQARTEARLEELAAAQARTETRLEELAAAQARAPTWRCRPSLSRSDGLPIRLASPWRTWLGR
jgi:septal ring factor EnvC (AmiA/AmiB activator)